MSGFVRSSIGTMSLMSPVVAGTAMPWLSSILRMPQTTSGWSSATTARMAGRLKVENGLGLSIDALGVHGGRRARAVRPAAMVLRILA